MKFHNKYILIAGLGSLVLFLTGLILELEYIKGFGFLTLGFPFGYFLGLLIKSKKKPPTLIFKPSRFRITIYVMILILLSVFLVVLRDVFHVSWINYLIYVGLLLIMVITFFVLLFKKYPEISNEKGF